MELLTVSHIALWLGFIALALINLALLRQVGVLFERIAPAGALMMNQQLKAGDKATSFELTDIDGQNLSIAKTSGGKSQLLFFLSPDCPVCSALIPAVKSSAKAEADWLQLVLASDGQELDHAGYVEKHGLQAFPYVLS